MMQLRGRVTALHTGERPLGSSVFQVVEPGTRMEVGHPQACLIDALEEAQQSDFELYLVREPPGPNISLREAKRLHLSGTVLLLPSALGHVATCDVVAVGPDLRSVAVLWKASAQHNSLLLTEQCDNYCLMCSQPPKVIDDSWLIRRASHVIPLLPQDVREVGLTGGEPTIHGGKLLDLLSQIGRERPAAAIHLLSNGRRFADRAFTHDYARSAPPGLMVGIPVYGPEPDLHDRIVQAPGAFDETVRGILNLGAAGQRIEIRIVIQRFNAPVLRQLAVWITRNLPFVEQVVLMGLEMTGLAKPNASRVWIDPYDYMDQLSQAAQTLTRANITAKIYNHPLCVLAPVVRHLANQSISDWKNTYVEACQECALRGSCCGVFSTSGNRLSQFLGPVSLANAT